MRLTDLPLNNSVQDQACLDSVITPSQSYSSSTPWTARLDLGFECASTQRTRLSFKHLGPLRIQKALYPEGPQTCHAVIVHPPGGIAAGDHLEVSAHVAEDSHGLVTTPSAAKWYGTNSERQALQRVTLNVNGRFEWLPQETIVFDRARVDSIIDIRLSDSAAMIGWDHLIFGRKASGESFDSGRFSQSLKISIDNELIWHDRLVLHGADPLFNSVVGLRGHHAFATVWAVCPAHVHWQQEWVQKLREMNGEIVWTQLHPRLLVGRLLTKPLAIKQILQQTWAALRLQVFNLPAIPPRLWAT